MTSASPASSPAIEVRQLSKKIGKTTILESIDLTVPRGAIVALVGHNGAGKTTLIKLLLNILRPTQGEAKVLGMMSSELRGEAFQRIGYVSEKQELPEWMTVGELMDHLRPLYPRWDDTELLQDLRLPLDRKIKHLSRGMRMKTALASTLAFGPELILMDEPFSGLDIAVRSDLIRSMLDGVQEGEVTILISSHDLDEVETFVTHVAFLDEGRLLFAESMDALLTRCREVTVTFEQDVAQQAVAKLAEGCIAAEASGAMLRFVDMHVNVADHQDAIRALMPDAVHVSSEGMNLRSIYLALHKEHRLQERIRA